MRSLLLLLVLSPLITFGLENGLARTPPMGWLSWERFRCNTDCAGDPENCIGERLFKSIADMMVLDGYLSVGYDTVIVDDCWLDHSRDSEGNLQPNHDNFPSGVQGLSDYLHKLGLKFGLYEDYGNFTCGGYPGVLQNMEKDAKQFAAWGVDYVKLDGCYSEPSTMETGYPEFGSYLNKTGRPMVYSCSWPAYQIGQHPNYPAIAEHCNLWRNFDDISDSWQSVLSIIDFYGEDTDTFSAHAGPGQWNDPDMLIIGNFGLSLDQARAQMGMWCMLAAPLIMSADLRTIRPEFRDIMVNSELIKLDQDPLGKQAKRILAQEHIHVYTRPVMPLYKEKTSVAVAWLSRWTEGTPLKVSCNLTSLGLDHPAGYSATDLFTGRDLGVFKPEDTFTGSVNPTSILLVRFNILPGERATGAEENSVNEVKTEEKIERMAAVEGDWLTVTYPGLRSPRAGF